MRLLVVAFLAMATAISMNALYFQEGQSLVASAKSDGAKKAEVLPAVKVEQVRNSGVTAALPEPTAPQAAPAPPTSPPPEQAETPRAPASKPAEPVPNPLVQSIQKKLTQFGVKAVPQDGLPSPETRAAILAVEFEQGRPLSGEPAEPILTTLYFLEASGRSRLASSDRFERDHALIEEVQDLLAKLGYTSGPVNGQLDGKTREAIRKFESDRRLKATGRLSERVLLEMVIERGKPFLSKG
jgi:peptidoglycan hydrolase-like protein with peptidoglycan-binding domain